jgi:hypothetical protein
MCSQIMSVYAHARWWFSAVPKIGSLVRSAINGHRPRPPAELADRGCDLSRALLVDITVSHDSGKQESKTLPLPKGFRRALARPSVEFRRPMPLVGFARRSTSCWPPRPTIR